MEYGSEAQKQELEDHPLAQQLEHINWKCALVFLFLSVII